MPVRQPQSRNHSHSVSLGAINANHRVTRRKSVSRKGTEASSIGATSGFSSYLSRGLNAASPDNAATAAAIVRKTSPSSIDENTAVDGTGPVGKPVSTKNRNRRASEGSPLMRGEGKRVSSELRCDQCGKGYKHSSCLTKHMCVYPAFHPGSSRLCGILVCMADLVLSRIGGNTILHGR